MTSISPTDSAATLATSYEIAKEKVRQSLNVETHTIKQVDLQNEPNPIKQTTDSDWEELFKEMDLYSLDHNFHLEFSVDKPSGRMVITVIDSETNQVIREIPPEETLRIAARLKIMAYLIDKMI